MCYLRLMAKKIQNHICCYYIETDFMRNNVNKKVCVFAFYTLQQTLTTNYYALPLGPAEGSQFFLIQEQIHHMLVSFLS